MATTPPTGASCADGRASKRSNGYSREWSESVYSHGVTGATEKWRQRYLAPDRRGPRHRGPVSVDEALHALYLTETRKDLAHHYGVRTAEGIERYLRALRPRPLLTGF